MRQLAKQFLLLALMAAAIFTGGYFGAQVNAQGPGPLVVTVSGGAGGDHTHCGAVALTGSAAVCHATDGLYQSVNGGAFVAIGGGSATVALTLNGVTKTLPAAFTVTAAPPTITTAAPIVTASAPASNSTAPALSVQ